MLLVSLDRTSNLLSRPDHFSRHILSVLETREVSDSFEVQMTDGRVVTQLNYPVRDNAGTILGIGAAVVVLGVVEEQLEHVERALALVRAGEQLADRACILPPHGDARENQGAGIDRGRRDSGAAIVWVRVPLGPLTLRVWPSRLAVTPADVVADVRLHTLRPVPTVPPARPTIPARTTPVVPVIWNLICELLELGDNDWNQQNNN